MARTRRNSRTLLWPQWTAVALGVLLALLGTADLLATGLDAPTGQPDAHVLGLRTNPLQGLLHVVTGVAAVLAAPWLRTERTASTLLSIVYLAAAAAGTSGLEQPGTNFLNANAGVVVLHFAVGVGFFAIAQSCTWCRQCGHTP
ncbi:DUF4383 domain-containing protein [Umezawaea beigongshangensis]|uniref:DUF4383 domain-containing protein n=1 Tax=Umezawaea beigongshangensis TaxID=2780383 RepID=UPI0018F15A5E|nr:DUF4383 domain-containing protein [Umezawaea beigongshangensis]